MRWSLRSHQDDNHRLPLLRKPIIRIDMTERTAIIGVDRSTATPGASSVYVRSTIVAIP